MTTQVVVRMPTRLLGRVDKAAKRLSRKRSDVVRLALEQWVEAESGPAGSSNHRKARGLLGSLSSGVPDLARRHRQYLIESLHRAR